MPARQTPTSICAVGLRQTVVWWRVVAAVLFTARRTKAFVTILGRLIRHPQWSADVLNLQWLLGFSLRCVMWIAIVGSCLASDADDEGTREPPAAEAPSEQVQGDGFVDDSRLIQKAEKQINAFIKGEQATQLNDLMEQLDRERCEVQLLPPATGALSPQSLYAQRSRSVVAILVSRKHKDHWHASVAASGFIISEDGVAVTNHHVFKASDEYLFGMTADGQVYPVKEVLATNKYNDAAIFQLVGENFTPVALRKGAPTGTQVRVISHPRNRLFSFGQGHIARKFVRRQVAKRGEQDKVEVTKTPPTRWVTITADYGLGSSGGPVFDRAGNIVAIATSTSVLRTPGKDNTGLTQMVFKDCVAAEVILDLIATPTP